MDIKRLKQFITLSNEDFADSHEPVNDGVKDVPDANDIAKMVGRSGGDSDLTKQGDGKVIPEQEDKEEDKGTEHTESKVDEGTGPGGQDDDQPEEKTESPVEDEPELAHDDVKAVDTDEKVTAKEKESLEAFVPKIKRAELIGYSTRDVKALTNSIGRIRAKAGVRGAFTVSAESISETIALAETHLGKLSRKRKFLNQRDLRVAKENFLPVEEAVITEAPLAHPGAVPLPPSVGVAMTEEELLPFADNSPEQQGIIDTLNQIQTLETSAVAVEQFRQLLRENKGRVSKQAAAIIHTSLEHIDQTCGLRFRTTGLESFDTTPRFALESTDINEKTLGTRAAEIGAKIMQFLKELLARGQALYQQHSSGLLSLGKKVDQLIPEVKKLNGFKPNEDSIHLSGAAADALSLDGEFVGLDVTTDERKAEKTLYYVIKKIRADVALPVIAAVKHGKVDSETLDAIEAIFTKAEQAHGEDLIPLPGNLQMRVTGLSVVVTTPESPRQRNHGNVTVDLDNAGELNQGIRSIGGFLKELTSDKTVDSILDLNNQLSRELISLRGRSKGADFDEALYQEIQKASSKLTEQYLSINTYFTVAKGLARATAARVRLYESIVEAWMDGGNKA